VRGERLSHAAFHWCSSRSQHSQHHGNSSSSSNEGVDTAVVKGQKLNVESKIDCKIYTVPEEAQSDLATLSDILASFRPLT
jgi:hypothetical protein